MKPRSSSSRFPDRSARPKSAKNTVKAVMKAGTKPRRWLRSSRFRKAPRYPPASGSTQDFSQPVKYTVTAEDSKTTRGIHRHADRRRRSGARHLRRARRRRNPLGHQLYGRGGRRRSATTVKVSLTYSGSPIADLTGYTFAVEATDAKSGAAAAWVKVSQVDASGAFTFTVDPNTDENARRATIAVSCTDNSGAKLFGSGSVGISQDGTEVGAQAHRAHRRSGRPFPCKATAPIRQASSGTPATATSRRSRSTNTR